LWTWRGHRRSNRLSVPEPLDSLSKLLRGHSRAVSVEKLLRMLSAFDQDVEITVRPHRKRGTAGRITFIPAA
jgi:predicted XRE-type DNA-binding protein